MRKADLILNKCAVFDELAYESLIRLAGVEAAIVGAEAGAAAARAGLAARMMAGLRRSIPGAARSLSKGFTAAIEKELPAEQAAARAAEAEAIESLSNPVAKSRALRQFIKKWKPSAAAEASALQKKYPQYTTAEEASAAADAAKLDGVRLENQLNESAQKYWSAAETEAERAEIASRAKKSVAELHSRNQTRIQELLELSEELKAKPKAPVTEAPVTEAPVTEAPVTEAPVTEAPAVESAAAEGAAAEGAAAEGAAEEAIVVENTPGSSSGSTPGAQKSKIKVDKKGNFVGPDEWYETVTETRGVGRNQRKVPTKKKLKPEHYAEFEAEMAKFKSGEAALAQFEEQAAARRVQKAQSWSKLKMDAHMKWLKLTRPDWYGNKSLVAPRPILILSALGMLGYFFFRSPGPSSSDQGKQAVVNDGFEAAKSDTGAAKVEVQSLQTKISTLLQSIKGIKAQNSKNHGLLERCRAGLDKSYRLMETLKKTPNPDNTAEVQAYFDKSSDLILTGADTATSLDQLAELLKGKGTVQQIKLVSDVSDGLKNTSDYTQSILTGIDDFSGEGTGL